MNGLCITMVSISRRFGKVKCFPGIGKKKRALAVLTEKAMINKTKEGMSLHDEYTMTVNVCQELQGLQQKKKRVPMGTQEV